MRWLALAVLLAACDPPQPEIEIEFSSGPAAKCPSTACNEIEMTCRSFFSVRILDPSDPMAPYHSECIEIPQRLDDKDICTIGGIDLTPQKLPYRDLEVQIAVFPAEVVTFDDLGRPVCPADTSYDFVTGFPIASADKVTPSLGGRGYYRAGDDVIHVTLGCSNLDALSNDQCEGIASVTVNATVEDFDSHLGVIGDEAERLSVGVGQPKPQAGGYALNNADLTPLAHNGFNSSAWSGTADELFTSHACITVLDDTPQSTTSVACRTAKVTDASIELNGAHAGVRLNKGSLDQILGALSLSQFPIEGLTIGVVVDGGVPVGNRVVSAPGATIEYLSSDRSTVTGTSTSGGPNGGVFVSRDAPFGTEFSTTSMVPPSTPKKIGGLIRGKVTIVVLDLSNPGLDP